MGIKVDALVQIAERGKPAEPLTKLAKILVAMLDIDFDLATDDQYALAESLLQLDEFKDVVKLANEAANELKDARNLALYDLMVANERRRFDHRGKLFHLTSQNFVQADKEQGGTKNPHLVEWLNNNGLQDLTKPQVNANALRGAVNKWMEDHSIEIDSDDTDFEEAEIIEIFSEVEFEPYVGVDNTTVTVEQQVAWRDHRRAQYLAERKLDPQFDEDGNPIDPIDFMIDVIKRRQELLQYVTITQKPVVGMKASS
jgi:hypothetical protein